MAEDAEDEIPRMPLITTRELEQQLTGARMPEQGREATAPAVPEPSPVVRGSSNKARQLAEQRFKPTGEKRPTSVKLDVWLDDALNAKVYELRMAGFRKMTRESVISDALMQSLALRKWCFSAGRQYLSSFIIPSPADENSRGPDSET